MAQVGNKINSFLNGEWARHVRAWGKRQTSCIRRMMAKEEIRVELSAPDYRMDGVDNMGTFDEYYNDGWNDWMYACGGSKEDTDRAESMVGRNVDRHVYPLSELCVMKKAA